MAKAKTELVVVEEELFLSEKPAFLGETARGNENMTADDCMIPLLMQCQALSRAKKKNEADYIEGIEDGDFYNSVTREVFGPEISVVFVDFKVVYGVWKKKTTVASFRGQFDTLQDADAKRRECAAEERLPVEAFDISKTHQHLAIVIHGKSTIPIILNMMSTKLKESRAINSMVAQFGGDRFSRVYKLKSAETSNDKGTFYILKCTPLGYANEAVYREAEELYNMREKIVQHAPVETDTDDDSETEY